MHAQKSSTRKIIGWIGGIVLVLLLLIGGAVLYFSSKWKPIVTAKIKEGVNEGSNHLYRIDFKDIHLNLLSGNIMLDSIQLTPDTTIYNRLKAIRKAPTHLFKLKLAHLKLSRVSILTAYFKRRINLNAIILDHPSIDMIYHKVPKRVDTLKDERTLYQQISKEIQSIMILDVKVVDADFDYYSGSKKLNSIKHLHINIKDILIDSLADSDTSRLLYAKDIGFELSGYKSLTKDKMYTLKVDTLRGSISKKTLKVKGIVVIPMYPDLTFSRKYSVQKDRYDLSFNELSFTGIDFISLNTDGRLHAKRLRIGPAKVNVFMNRELPPPNFDKGRNYPHNALKRLLLETLIDTVSLSKVDVVYTEYNPKSKERGTLNLANLTGSILNVTNDSLGLTRNNHALADLTSYIMGVGKMNVKIDFNLTDPLATFNYIGQIGSFNMQVLNPLAKSLGLIEIKSGTVQHAKFNISANVKSSKGTVVFYYNDLKVNLLKENADGGVKEKKGLLSFLANTILIKNDNPTKDEAVRKANVSFERVPQASFFNLMWKSVFVGIRETVGIGAVPMKPIPKPNGKEKRQQKRAERKAEKAKIK